MAYRPPHARTKPKPVPVVEPTALDTSCFPSLGNATTATAAKDYKKLAWGEASKESEAEKEARLVREAREAAKESFRQSCRIPEPKPQIQNDEYQEAQLAYRDWLDALRYEEENPLPEAVHEKEDEWEKRETKVVQAPKQMEMPKEEESEYEMTQDEMRERMDFLRKRLRRNGILREDKEAFEKELRELERMCWSESD